MFAVRMAWRELRQSWVRLLFFFLCVAIGVAAIVLLRSVVETVRRTLTAEARTLVGADLVVQQGRAWTAGEDAILTRELAEGGLLARSRVVESQTMAAFGAASSARRVRLVELRAVEAAFPYYGTLELAGGAPYSHGLLAGRGVLVTPELMAEFGMAVGDTLNLAGQPFTVRAVVTKDRIQRGGASFAFGPRVYLDLADLGPLGLLGVGSRATHAHYLKVDAAALDRLTTRLRAAFANRTVGVRSWRTLEDRLGRNLTIAENYLSLVGFAIVVLGGIGVWSVTRVVVQQKTKSVAILKCVGASSGRILAIYGLLVAWLAAVGSALGIGLAALTSRVLPESILISLGVRSVGITASASAQGALVGLLVSLLFALVPLLEMRRVKPLLLLRADTAAGARRRDWRSLTLTLAIGAALSAVSMWQAGSILTGLFVVGGLVVLAAALAGASRLLIRLVRPLAASTRFPIRHAVVSLGRPGNQTGVILMAVGLGCFFVLSVRAIQANLLAEFDAQLSGDAPDVVLIDVQPDQAAGVQALVETRTGRPARLLPLLRARVVGVEGRRVTLPNLEAVRRARGLGREFGVTFREALEPNERLVEGAWWTGAPEAPGDVEVSIVTELVRDASLGLGDRVRFDVAGVPVTAVVTSVREVAWDNTESGGFFFVLRPGASVRRLPHAFVGFVDTGADPGTRGGLQRDLVGRFPNVSAIDVTDVLAAVRKVIDSVTLGITVVGAVTLVSGLLILVGAVAMTKFQRLYDAAIYRTLGASHRLIAAMTAVEYGVLGALAGLLGAAGAFGLSWALAVFLFEIPWRPAPAVLAAGVGSATALVALVGLAASLDVLFRKPLATLRGE